MTHLNSTTNYLDISHVRGGRRSRRTYYYPLPNGEVGASYRGNREYWNGEMVQRASWTPLIEDRSSSNGVIDRGPLVDYRNPADIQLQRDIPQASSSSRRQFGIRM
ncbi:unnamed protein product [Rodentolepis nana]|uniref:Uncharacterized protein n=1 Tax=Rodentolepis nana TaxID=102285 RepID=A0A0R3T4L0_RODNA|nr:unnamed protein product [Rodentolepis nana]